MMKRANVGMETVQKMALGLVMLLLVTYFIGMSSDIGKLHEESVTTCRMSVMANEQSKSMKGIPSASVECPTGAHLVKDVVKDDDVKKFLAAQMASCWWKFGEGNANPFSDVDESGRERTHVCAVCSLIRFDEDVAEKFPEVSGFPKYLADHEPPFRFTTQYDTYYEYFTRNIPTTALRDTLVESDAPLSSSLDYAVLFVLDKHNTDEGLRKLFNIGSVVPGGIGASGTFLVYSGLALTTGGVGLAGAIVRAAVVGLGTGAIFGNDFAEKHKEAYGAGVLLVPYDEENLPKNCDTLGVDPFEHWFFRDRAR